MLRPATPYDAIFHPTDGMERIVEEEDLSFEKSSIYELWIGLKNSFDDKRIPSRPKIVKCIWYQA